MADCIVCTRDEALFCHKEAIPVKQSMPRLYRRVAQCSIVLLLEVIVVLLPLCLHASTYLLQSKREHKACQE